MSLYSEKIQARLLGSLNTKQYYQVKGEAVTLETVHWIERIVRFIGHLFNLCDSTTQKCHRISLEQLQKIASFSHPPQIDPKYRIQPLVASDLENFWIAYKVLNLAQRKQEVIQEIGWPSLLRWVDSQKAAEVLEPFEQVSFTLDTPAQAKSLGKAYASGRDFLTDHMSLKPSQLPMLDRFLKGERFKKEAHERPLTLDYAPEKEELGETLTFKWPSDKWRDYASTFQLHFSGISALEVNAEALDSYSTKKLIEILLTNPITQIKFTGSSEPTSILPLEIAQALSKMSSVKILHLGFYTWPLREEALPAICTLSYSQLRSCETVKEEFFPLSWNKFQDIQSLCPNVEFIDGSNQSYSIPEGILRRMSGHFNDYFQNYPSDKFSTPIHHDKALMIFQMVQASLKENPAASFQDIETFVELALDLEMPFALQALKRSFKGFFHIDESRVCKKALPTATECLSDIIIDTGGDREPLHIELYQLAQQAPTRCWGLLEYPRHRPIYPEEDKQITLDDLTAYFKAERITLNCHNLSSFWAIALVFKDASLFAQVERWLKTELRKTVDYSNYLEDWQALAISSQELGYSFLALLPSYLPSLV